MDLVVPLSRFSHLRDDLELRFMLRSVVANYRDLCRVFIVGHKPAWLQEGEGLKHLPCPDPHGVSKDANIIHKLLLACQEVHSDFLVNSDDQMFCSPIDDCNLWVAWLDPTINLKHCEECRNRSLWHDRLLRSLETCRQQNWPEHIWECHVPYPVDWEWYPRVMGKVDWNAGNGLWTHLYLSGYMAEAFPRRINPPVVLPPALTVRYRKPVSYAEARQALDKHRFVNFNDSGWTDGMKKALGEKFAVPSPWE